VGNQYQYITVVINLDIFSEDSFDECVCDLSLVPCSLVIRNPGPWASVLIETMVLSLVYSRIVGPTKEIFAR